MVKRAFGLGKKHALKRTVIVSSVIAVLVITGIVLAYKITSGSKVATDAQRAAVAATTDTVSTKEDATTPVVQTPTPATTETTPVAQQPATTPTETSIPAATQTMSAEDVEYQALLDKVCPGTQQWIDAMDQQYVGHAVELLRTNDAHSWVWKMYYEKCVAAGRLTALY